MLFCSRVVRKATEQVNKKALDMLHQAQNGFCGTFVGITQHQKWNLVYIPSTRKIISSYDVVFDESFSISLSCTSQPYVEAMAMRTAVSYTSCDTSSKEQTGDIIKLTHFEKGNLLSDNLDNTERIEILMAIQLCHH